MHENNRQQKTLKKSRKEKRTGCCSGLNRVRPIENRVKRGTGKTCKKELKE
jgi:hypothetical protein